MPKKQPPKKVGRPPYPIDKKLQPMNVSLPPSEIAFMDTMAAVSGYSRAELGRYAIRVMHSRIEDSLTGVSPEAIQDYTQRIAEGLARSGILDELRQFNNPE